MDKVDSDSNIRFSAVDQIVENFLEEIRKGHGRLFLEIKYHPDKLRKAIEDYYSDLDYWKKFFQVPDKLDRHKVSALTAHYFLINRPIEIIQKEVRLKILLFINEILAWHICLSRLKSYETSMKLDPVLYATFLKISNGHAMLWNEGEVTDSNRLKLRFYSVFTFLMEQNHGLKVFANLSDPEKEEIKRKAARDLN